jgi:hypothetical protein
MSLSKEQQIFTRHIAELICYANSIGIELTFGEAYRTIEQQEIYVKQGKSKTMNSKHLKRLAVDFNFFINGKLVYDFHKVKSLGEFWTSLDSKNRWGGDWNKNGVADGFLDTPHFERKF